MATFSTFNIPKGASSGPPKGGSKKIPIPETVVSGDSSKRNILRKGRGGAASKFKAKHATSIDDGSTYDDELDPGDPCYDHQENDDDYILEAGDAAAQAVRRGTPPRRSYDPALQRMVIGPAMVLSEFKRRVNGALEEYFSSEDVAELMSTITELNCPDYHYDIVKRAISLSLDRAERERELISKFFSAAYPKVLSTDQLGKGFERVFEFVDDLEIDAPGASNTVAAFLARAVVDEVLPPSFLVDHVVMGLGGEVVEQTKRMLGRDHQYSRVERIWGPGDGRPVEELKQAIDALLPEYLISGDLTEAERCVRELRVPHFHHELVKRAVALVVDKPEQQQLKISQLFRHLCVEEVLSQEQLQMGLAKTHSKIDDIKMDAPCAPDVLAFFIQTAIDQELIDLEFAKSMAAGNVVPSED